MNYKSIAKKKKKNCQYKSFQNVREVCNYIRTVYIPKDCQLPSVHERLQAKRKQRAELAQKEGSGAVGFLDIYPLSLPYRYKFLIKHNLHNWYSIYL